MAPNRRGSAPQQQPAVTRVEVEARGAGTAEHGDSYDDRHRLWNELRVFFTGEEGVVDLSWLLCAGCGGLMHACGNACKPVQARGMLPQCFPCSNREL